MCGVNLFCMFLLLFLMVFLFPLIATSSFMGALGPLYSFCVGLPQFIRLLVVACRSCCCEYVRNSP